MKMDKHGWKCIKVDENGQKWVKWIKIDEKMMKKMKNMKMMKMMKIVFTFDKKSKEV